MIVGTPEVAFLHVALNELRVAHLLVAPIRLSGADEICYAIALPIGPPSRLVIAALGWYTQLP